MSTPPPDAGTVESESTADPALRGRMIAHATTTLPIAQDVAWRLITQEAPLQQWYAFGGATVEPVEGGRIQLAWEEGKTFLGRVERFSPTRRFDYRLPQLPNVELADDNATLVQYLITPAPDRANHTVVTVREHGFEDLAPAYDPPNAFSSSAVAWIGALGLLRQLVGFAEPPRAGSPDTGSARR